MKLPSLEHYTLCGSMVVSSASEDVCASVVRCADVAKQIKIWQYLQSCNRKNFIK